VDVVADSGAVTVVSWASVVPAVLGRASLGESLATLGADQTVVPAGIAVEFVLEFGRERPLAVPARVNHAVYVTILR
jgi:hypothetical protein